MPCSSGLPGLANAQGVASANPASKHTSFLTLTALQLMPTAVQTSLHLHEHLANDMPCRLCDSVDASLVGQRLGSFTRISSAVRTALEAALTRILTPKRSIDVLREVCFPALACV